MALFDLVPHRRSAQKRAATSDAVMFAARAPMGAAGIPDFRQLRQWRAVHPLIVRATALRMHQIVNARWDILPIDPDAPFSEPAQDALREVFSNPNPGGKNNSFGGLVGPGVDDLLTLDLMAIQPVRTMGDWVKSLISIDSARVRFRKGWETPKDGPRYMLMDEEMRLGVELDNHELITIVSAPNTYSETGMPPMRALARTLEAYDDTFNRIHTMQVHGGPGGVVNIADVDDDDLKSLRRRWENIEGAGATAFTGFSAGEIEYFQLGSPNLEEQGAFQFYAILVREICAAYAVSPIDLMQEQDTHRTSADVQAAMTLDDGVKPLMRLIAGYFNREVVASYDLYDEAQARKMLRWADYRRREARMRGARVEQRDVMGDGPRPVTKLGANLQFVFTDLALANEPDDAKATRMRFGDGGSWISINQSLLLDGQPPIKETGDPIVDAFLNEPRLVSGMGGITMPVSLYAYQTAKTLGLQATPPDGTIEVEPAAEVADENAENGPIVIEDDADPAADDQIEADMGDMTQRYWAKRRKVQARAGIHGSPDAAIHEGEQNIIQALDELFTDAYEGRK